jgi:hypothetical protein
MASARVYAVLLHQPQWYGVPLRIVLWNFIATMGFLLLVIFLVPPIVLKLLLSVVVLFIAVGIHVALSRSGKTDPDLMEVVLRFVTYPRYLGNR